MKLAGPVVAAIAALTALAVAQTVSASLAQSGVAWVLPTAAPVLPQTEAEVEHGKRLGRALPPAEVLQPTLDPALSAYVARTTPSAHFRAASSDVLPGLAKAWAAAFQRYHPGVRIDVEPPYAGSLGADELVKGNLDFVFVSRELRPSDIAGFRAKYGYDPLSVPISGGSYRHFGFLDTIGFIVNKENPIERVSFEQLDRLFSSTHHRGGNAIATWGDLGLTGEWTDKPVHLYGVQPWNGFEEFVRQRVLSTPGHRGEWRDGITFSKTVFPIAAAVANDRYALAYDGIAYLSAPVKVLALAQSADAPYYAPSYENVALGGYPLSRLVYFNTNRAPGKPLPPAEAEFLRFILSRDGQAIVRDQGIFVPLRASQVRASRELLGP